MGTVNRITTAQRTRRWACLASQRATDPDSDTRHWQGVAASLYRAAELQDQGDTRAADTILSGTISGMIRHRQLTQRLDHPCDTPQLVDPDRPTP